MSTSVPPPHHCPRPPRPSRPTVRRLVDHLSPHGLLLVLRQGSAGVGTEAAAARGAERAHGSLPEGKRARVVAVGVGLSRKRTCDMGGEKERERRARVLLLLSGGDGWW